MRLTMGFAASAAAALLVCGTIEAQTPAPRLPEPDAERASFYLLRDADTVIVERSWRTPSELHGEFLDRTRGARLEFVASITPDKTINRLATHSYRSATDSAGEIATFELEGDQLLATLGKDGPVPLPSIEGALPIVNPSIAFIEQLVMRARVLSAQPAVSVPVFLIGTQNATQASVSFKADSAVIVYANVIMRVAISAAGRVLGGAVPAQHVTIVRGPAGPPLAAEKRVSPMKNEEDFD